FSLWVYEFNPLKERIHLALAVLSPKRQLQGKDLVYQFELAIDAYANDSEVGNTIVIFIGNIGNLHEFKVK
ncbi:17255_t:CDS:2, partial [Racocetra persica]